MITKSGGRTHVTCRTVTDHERYGVTMDVRF
jgi:hypothetical protein